MKTDVHQSAAEQPVGYKFWPHVGRVDNVFSDRNPVFSCVVMENYQS
jgi:hypothetical protein